MTVHYYIRGSGSQTHIPNKQQTKTWHKSNRSVISSCGSLPLVTQLINNEILAYFRLLSCLQVCHQHGVCYTASCIYLIAAVKKAVKFDGRRACAGHRSGAISHFYAAATQCTHGLYVAARAGLQETSCRAATPKPFWVTYTFCPKKIIWDWRR